MFDPDPNQTGDSIFYLADGNKVKKLAGTQINKWSKTLDNDTVIRITNMGGFVPFYKELKMTGARFVSAAWSKTGIPKNLGPEEMVAAFLTVPEDVFQEVCIREDIWDMRQLVQARLAVMDYRKRCQLRFGSIGRSMGIKDKDKTKYPPALQKCLAEIAITKKEYETPIDKAITEAAKRINECRVLNKILGVEGSWISAAAIVAFIGDPSRFDTLPGLYKYAGCDVTADNKAPKRARGAVAGWNGKLRTALWLWCDSMLKTKNPLWRPLYDEYRAQELAVHEQKCEKCRDMKQGTEAQKELRQLTIQSHSGARARKKVYKRVLKEYYLATHQDQANNSMADSEGVHACELVGAAA
jgi:hypothetical protein